MIAHTPLQSQGVGIAFLVLTLWFLVPSQLSAQPGAPLPLEFYVKQMQPSLDALTHQISRDPEDVTSLMRRAEIYRSLYNHARYVRKESQTYADSALADLSKAIEVKPSSNAYTARAEWHVKFWHEKGPEGGKKIEAVVDYLLNDPHFSAAKADLLESIRINKSGENLLNNYLALGELHLRRAQALAKPAEIEEVRARATNYLLWEDFDTAIEYTRKAAKQGRTIPLEWPKYFLQRVNEAYATKARAAVDLGDYDLALESFQAGIKYLDEGSASTLCLYYSSWAKAYSKKGMPAESIELLSKALVSSPWNCRFLFEQRAAAYVAFGDVQKAVDDYTAQIEHDPISFEVRIKRAKLYLALGEPHKARDDLDHAIDRSYFVSCPQPFLLRAQAHRQLGNVERGANDEGKAEALKGSTCAEF